MSSLDFDPDTRIDELTAWSAPNPERRASWPGSSGSKTACSVKVREVAVVCDRLTDDAASGLLERRWFAAARATAEIKNECDALAQVIELTQAAWRGARLRLAKLEALRELLGEELAAAEARESVPSFPRLPAYSFDEMQLSPGIPRGVAIDPSFPHLEISAAFGAVARRGRAGARGYSRT
jgi:hypothetical protein